MTLPPIHPALVHLPIAFVVLAFFADLLARFTKSESLSHVGFWSMLAALLGGGATIIAGYWDMNRASLDEMVHTFVHQHLIIGWVVAASVLVLTAWRWWMWLHPQHRVRLSYLLACFVVFALTLFQGWYGGEMVFSHGAGVAAAGQGTEPTEKAQQRLADVYDALTPSRAMGKPGAASSGHGSAADHEH